MSAINVGEVYYFLRKHKGRKLAETWRETSGGLPFTIDVPSGDDIWNAAVLKSQFPIGKKSLDSPTWRAAKRNWRVA
jgi:hypothetical protein